MDEPLLGSIVLFAGNFAPRGWMLCAGQTLPIQQYSALFAILGTTYGGNGTTNFNLPDLRGRAPVGTGQGTGLNPIELGEMAGSQNASLQLGNLPPHSHALVGSNFNGDSTNPTNNVPATVNDPNTGTQSNSFGQASNSPVAMAPTGVAGSGAPLNIQNPFLGMNYIIAIQGIFPSRN